MARTTLRTGLVIVHATLTAQGSTGTGIVDFIADSKSNTARKETDLYGSYNTATGVWTCPATLQYNFFSMVTFNTSSTAAPTIFITDLSNNIVKYLCRNTTGALSGSVSIPCVIGEQYKFRVDRGTNACALYGDSTGTFTSLSIVSS